MSEISDELLQCSAKAPDSGARCLKTTGHEAHTASDGETWSPYAKTDPTQASVAPCNWAEDEDGNWFTDCGDGFTFIDGTPDENHMKFCCYCGKPLTVSRYKEPDVEPD